MEDPSHIVQPALYKVLIDQEIERHESDGFRYSLGTYPTEPLTARPGFTMLFEAADGSDPSDFTGEGFADDLEEWPDRYVYDILVSHERLRPLCRVLFSLLPGRFFPILDVLGHDAYREIDPYIAYDPVSAEKFYDAIRFYEPWFFEDGLMGFGALSLDPFLYVFIDEHKIVTLRIPPEMKDKVEKILAAFDLSAVEELHGPDSVAHEHRGVLSTPENRPEVMSSDEVIERLRDNWLLQLNIDPTRNLDSEGNDLGLTPWQCIVRCTPKEESQPESYAEVLLTSGSLQRTEELAAEAVRRGQEPAEAWEEVEIIRADRLLPDQLREWLGKDKPATDGKPGVHEVRWLTGTSAK